MNKPADIEFSVVIPTYNASLFIKQTVESVLSQTFENFEVIIVDDGSEDATIDILRSITDERLGIHCIKHSGYPARPRNYGVAKAQGKYVAFLDADDFWPMEKLDTFHEYIVSKRAAFAFSNGVFVDQSGTPGRTILPPLIKKRVWRVCDPLLLLTNVIPCSSVVIDRALARANPFLEDAAFKAVEDYLLWLQINQYVPIYYVARRLLYKRIHEQNISGDYGVQLERNNLVLAKIGEGYDVKLIDVARRVLEVKRLISTGQQREAIKEMLYVFGNFPIRHKRVFLEYALYCLLQLTAPGHGYPVIRKAN